MSYPNQTADHKESKQPRSNRPRFFFTQDTLSTTINQQRRPATNQSTPRGGTITKRRKSVFAAIAIVVITTAAVLWRRFGDPLHFAARREWKDQAIAAIHSRLADKSKLEQDVASLNSQAAAHHNFGDWVGEDLLVMRNHDWLLCENICQKSESRIPDILIGYGSNGRWYYSTFHFCVGKCVLQMETQPDSLKEFVDGYWLVEFDGKSDECLKQTWNGGMWGTEKPHGATTSP